MEAKWEARCVNQVMIVQSSSKFCIRMYAKGRKQSHSLGGGLLQNLRIFALLYEAR